MDWSKSAACVDNDIAHGDRAKTRSKDRLGAGQSSRAAEVPSCNEELRSRCAWCSIVCRRRRKVPTATVGGLLAPDFDFDSISAIADVVANEGSASMTKEITADVAPDSRSKKESRS